MTAVMAYAKVISKCDIRIQMKANWIFHGILILMGKSLVKWSLPLIFQIGVLSELTIILEPLNSLTPSDAKNISNQTIIGSDNGLLPDPREAIIWTNDGIRLIGPLGTNFSEILIEIATFSFKKMRLKVSSVKWRPFCLSHDVLTHWAQIKFLKSYQHEKGWTWLQRFLNTFHCWKVATRSVY